MRNRRPAGGRERQLQCLCFADRAQEDGQVVIRVEDVLAMLVRPRVRSDDLRPEGDLDPLDGGTDDDLAVSVEGGRGVAVALEGDQAGAAHLRRPDQLAKPGARRQRSGPGTRRATGAAEPRSGAKIRRRPVGASFRAATFAFNAACEKAGLKLLEPVMRIEIQVADEYYGNVVNDLTGRRAVITDMDVHGDMRVIRGIVSVANAVTFRAVSALTASRCRSGISDPI